METVRGVDCVEAWRGGAQAIHNQGRNLCNLMIEIENPTRLTQAWLETYNPRSIGPDADNIRHVINTVFPYRLRNRVGTRAEFYEKYQEIALRARRIYRNRGAWGTYFHRLIDFSNDGQTNQLEIAITKLNTWNQRSTTGLVFHLSSPQIDNPRTRGGPCWHFGELLWQRGDRIDLVVVYRNHDYFNKALGNFISLGQLLDFICAESNKTAGKLICHSVHAYYDAPRYQMIRLAQLLQ